MACSGEAMVKNSQFVTPSRQPIPMSLILLAVLAVHLPLLLMKLPLKSYDTNFHIFFASHYLHHWFDPWNPKWYRGLLADHLSAAAAAVGRGAFHIFGLDMAYMAVQLIAILLLAVGVYRFSMLWVSPRAASFAALASVFLGAESFLVYSAGQLATTAAAPLYLNALPFLYEWIRYRAGARSSRLRCCLPPRPPRTTPRCCSAPSSLPFQWSRWRSWIAMRASASQPPAFVLRTVVIVAVVRRGDCGGLAAVLDRAVPLSSDADAHPPSQPRQLHPEPAMGH